MFKLRHCIFYQQNHLSACPCKVVYCTNQNCGEILLKKDVVEHVASLCQWRIVLCVHCNEPHPKCQEEVCKMLYLDILGWKLITCIMQTVAVMKLKDKNSQYSMCCFMTMTWLFCFNLFRNILSNVRSTKWNVQMVAVW